jgi:outer membrane scaffolding protein for murein synthesis (MipA/OmpV family)
MAEEEKSESTGSSIKNMIIGLVSTITLGVGTWVTTKLTGGEKEETPVQTAAPVINITNSNQQQQQAAGKTVIIKEKAAGAAQPAAQPQPKPKKKEGDEFKEEAPKW